MIRARMFMTSSSAVRSVLRNRETPLLSIVLLCRPPRTDTEAKVIILRYCNDPGVEIIVVAEGSRFHSDAQTAFASWCRQHGCHVVEAAEPTGLAALRFNQGIIASSGEWVWLIQASNAMPSLSVDEIASFLEGLPPTSALIVIHPHDRGSIVGIQGIRAPWLDLLYKGLRIPLENVFLRKDIFASMGQLDPHIAIMDCFGEEYLLRIARYINIEDRVHNGAAVGIHKGELPSLLYHWLDIDRREELSPDRFRDYSLDDFEKARGRLSEGLLWEAYLEKVLPYYWANRDLLPEGFLEAPQSLPPIYRRVLCVKGDYETSTDVGIRNFDLFAHGERFHKLTYMHAGQVSPHKALPDDALLFLRTASWESMSLAETCLRSGLPIGYALDDDLLNFAEYGGGFAFFRAGHPAYDTMVSTMKMADVVLCAGSHVEKAAKRVNPRTIQYSGSVLPEFLPNQPRPKNSPFKFGYAGGSYRAEEFRMMWPAIERLCRELGDTISFELWGISPAALPTSPEQVKFLPFSLAYYEYLGRLKSAAFDGMLAPLLLEPSPRRGKSPNKLYESAVAGAVGIFSDVPTYSVIKDNTIGLIAGEDPQSWYEVMRGLVEMDDEKYLSLKNRAFHYVKEFYTTPAMLHTHEACVQALFFHSNARDARLADGRPQVAYVLPVADEAAGGLIVFKRRLELAITAGIAPLAILPSYVRGTPEWASFRRYLDLQAVPYDFADFRVFVIDPPKDDVVPSLQETESVIGVFRKYGVRLVHTGGFAPAVGQACVEMGIPHVVAHYGVDENYEWPGGSLPYKYCDIIHSDTVRYAKKWGQLFGCQWYCARDVAPSSLFDTGFDRLFGSKQSRRRGEPTNIGIVANFMERKSQLEAVRGLSLLVKRGRRLRLFFYGKAGDPRYLAKCQDEVRCLGLHDTVRFEGYLSDLNQVYRNLDIVLCASTFESLPTAIKEATSAGSLVVTTPVGGVPELLHDAVNCIMTRGYNIDEIVDGLERALDLSEEENLLLRRNAFHMAKQIFDNGRGRFDLLQIYNLAYRLATPIRNNGLKPPGADPGRASRSRKRPNLRRWLFDCFHPSANVARLRGRLSYRIKPPKDNWAGLDILIATYMRPALGTLRLQVFGADSALLRDVMFDLAEAEDNGWASLGFVPIANSADRRFIVLFSLVNPGRDTRVGLYQSRSPASLLRRALRKARLLQQGDKLECRLRYSK